MSPTTHFTNPAEHPLTSDLVARLESAEREIASLKSQIIAMEAFTHEVRPRSDADLSKLSSTMNAAVVAADGTQEEIDRSIIGQPTIIHRPKQLGMKLYAYSHVQHGEPLHIVFHGAMITGTWFPRFERVRTMTERGRSFCTLADPTIQLDHGLKLGWYVGHDGADTLEWISSLVDRLRVIAGARQLIFVGSSGGGYAALQASHLFPGSLAFVMDPQTVVTNYHAAQVQRFLRVGFDNMSPLAAIQAHPDRLSAVARYAAEEPTNWVYYTQHLRDRFHIENHLRPFGEVFGLTDPTADYESDRFKLSVVERGKHGPLSYSLFEKHLEAATKWHAAKLDDLKVDSVNRHMSHEDVS